MNQRILPFALSLYAVTCLVSMAFMNIGFFALFAVLLSSVYFSKKVNTASFRKNSEFKKYLFWAGALFVTCLLSLVIAKTNPMIYADHEPEITAHGFIKIWYLAIPLVVLEAYTQIKQNRAGLLPILRPWLASLIPLFLIALTEYNFGWPMKQIIPTNTDHFHVILLFGHHLSVASILIFPTFVALSLCLGSWIRDQKFLTFESFIAFIGMIILFLTYARTAWITLPIGIILLFIRYLKPKTILIGIAALVLFIASASQTSSMKERIAKNYGVSERLELWKANIDFFKHRPLTGVGWLKNQELSEFYFKSVDPIHYRQHFWGHAHSNIFEMLGGTGVLGFFAFLGWSFFTLRLAYRTSLQAAAQSHAVLGDLSYGIFVALIILHLNGLTNVTFWEGKVMHSQMLAVSILLIIQWLLTENREKSLILE